MNQVQIILWKNFILICQNKLKFIAEIIFSLLFPLILLLIIYSVDPEEYKAPKFNKAYNILDHKNKIKDIDEKIIYYYPNNPFVRSIVKGAFVSLFGTNKTEKNVIGSNISDANYLSEQEKQNLFAHISFSNVSSLMDFKNNIFYSIFTIE